MEPSIFLNSSEVVTLVGEGKGPHMFDISWVLGKEETIARMKRAVEVLK